MRVSVIAPVLNEVAFIGYSVMAVLPYVHEILYGIPWSSDDGTRSLLYHIKKKYAHEKLIVLEDLHLDDGSTDSWDFNPLDMKAYDNAFNRLIEASSGDAVWFLHPDMLVTNPEAINDLKEGPLAWTVNMKSYARDFNTVITKGRTDKWKNIHAKKFGLHYFGGYGSQNEDFYHSDITGKTYRHYGSDFNKYPFEVAQSAINVNHYCELKPYKRRLEKMRLCLKTQYPELKDDAIDECTVHHPRVTLEPSSERFGQFEFAKTDQDVPEVITKYREEFEAFQKELVAL